MNYFVSANLKAYHDWQIELLLESFSSHLESDKLHVAFTMGGHYRYPYTENINKIRNGYIYENFGEKKGFDPLNEIYQLSHLINEKKIKMPLVVIKPHMVMKNPMSKLITVGDYRAFIYNSDPFFTFDNAVKNAGNFWEKLNKPREFYESGWFNLGNVYLITGFPDWFCSKIVRVTEDLVVDQIMKNQKVWDETVRLAWVVSIIDSAKDIDILPNFGLSAIMNEGRDAVFIDYEHGLPPQFSNSMYKYTPPKYISFGDPIEKITECEATPNAHYMSKIAKCIVDRRKINAK